MDRVHSANLFFKKKLLLAKIRSKLRSKFERFLKILFPFFEKLGVHILPVSFYSPVPTVSALGDSVFEKISQCPGIDWKYENQCEILKTEIKRFCTEKEFEKNEGLNIFDAAVLHSLIRSRKPKRAIEIGAGQSTLFILDALKRNQKEGYDSKFTSIEPYLNPHLRSIFPPELDLVEKPVQAIDLNLFKECDLLFIDSSHVVKIGSDVLYEILEIIPRVKLGTLIHFHDILIPGEYWPVWVKKEHYFWNEQYFLQSFLAFNSSFQIVWASRYMQLNAYSQLKEVFPKMTEQDHISSFWIQRVN